MKQELTFRKIIKNILKKVPSRPDPLASKARLALRISECAQDGFILISESGRDCDGSEWHGKTFKMKASVMVYLKAHDEAYQWADGPFSWEIKRPSEAKYITYSSRDLALEAFEDGHPHLLHSNL